ncbi:helix-turn-helix domain-containing protein [Altererythrobacter arenosus]|uniref:Helix-turn-helix domain-containing protein n=1 Tax=Altererythrobacter arenosus TaxID=3032592 RepID=A0ABY8FMP9_9SPHN|nr:helix-turn-helix domain-containing protein [Altererythrobacter sp. CAU 1644]WFL76304.1 helix-turn-helix domain-containing protein [Altererythrobacter sp. CAU 1644]
MPASAPQRPVSISLVAVPEVSAAIVLSLHEVFAYVGVAWEALTGDRYETRSLVPRIVGRSTEPIRTSIGAMLVPDHTFAEMHRSDVVIVADLFMDDGLGPVGRWKDEIAWIRNQYSRGAIVCSVCTGSMMLAEAGLLDDVDATTHWSATQTFAECYPRVILQPERLLVPGGHEHRIVTSGGSASWTELALYLVARFCGEAEARRTAKIFLFGDLSHGQMPFAAMVRPKQHDDEIIADSQQWIAEHYATANPVSRMASRSGLAERTFKRRFAKCTGYAPLDYVQSLRIEEAKQMLETTDRAIDDIALDVGYEDPNSFRRLFKRTTSITPSQYRLKFQSIAAL